MSENYYCVHVYNPINFGGTTSPQYQSLAECHAWLQSHLFDRGAHVEIRYISTIPVSSTEFDTIDTVCDSGLSYSAESIAHKLLWDNGCIDKNYFVRNKK